MAENKNLPEKIVVDNYFGLEVEDPYRFMENSTDSLVLKWYDHQTNLSNSILSKIKGRNSILESINSYSQKTSGKVSNIKITQNGNYFYLKETSKNNIKMLYRRTGFKDSEELIFDPSSLDKEYLINYIGPNWDGSLVVVSLTKDDQEISIMKIIDTKSKKLFPIEINNCWPSALGGVHWMPNNRSFTYEYIPVTDKSSEQYILDTATVLYTVGENPSNLNIVFSRKNNTEIQLNPEDFPEVDLQNQNDSYVFGGVFGPGPYQDVYYTDANNVYNKKIVWRSLFSKLNKIKQYYIRGDELFFLTAENAPNFKICKTSLKNPDFQNPITVVEEDSKMVITDLEITSDDIFFVKKKNGVEAFFYRVSDNKRLIQNIELPNPSGHVNIINKGILHNDIWIETEGWITKKRRYRFDQENNSFQLEDYNHEISSFNSSNIIVKEIEVKGHDGAKIPLSIIHKKGLKFNGQSRLLLSGYGAYGISDRPKFEKYMPHWIELGGVYAIAHVRGGGEKGDSWHLGGFKTNKPNTWKDFISCTEYLIGQKYTSQEFTAIFSASAGGILIGKSITERPDLYKCAMIRVGVLNTIRTETGPNGLNNVKEFGTVKDSVEFKALMQMDAYHSIQENTKYPAMLLTAGLKDARVNAWESGKFVAKLKKISKSDNPILFLVDNKGGHGLNTTQSKENIELANMLSFALWQTGHPYYQPE